MPCRLIAWVCTSQAQLLRDHTEAFLQGYGHGWEVVRELHSRGSGFIADFAREARGAVIRRVPRPTALYVLIGRILHQPSCLASEQAARLRLSRSGPAYRLPCVMHATVCE